MHKNWNVLRDPDSGQGSGAVEVAPGNAVEGVSAVPSTGVGSGDSNKRWGVNYTVNESLPENSPLKGQEIDFGDGDGDIAITPPKEGAIVKSAESGDEVVVVDSVVKGEVVKPTAEVKPVVENKLNIPQPKREEVKQPEVKKQETVPLKQEDGKQQPKVDRDISSYPQDIQPQLKKMSNDAFTLFEKTYTERNEYQKKFESQEANIKSLEENGLPLSYFSHPAAVTLHPFYQQSTQTLGKIDNELGYYKQQLKQIQLGENWKQLVRYDEAGRPVFSAEMPANEQALDFVNNIIARGSQQKADTEVKLTNMVNGFQGHIAKVDAYINKAINDYWPWHNDTKSPLQKDRQQFMDLIPLETRYEKSAPVAALLYATLQDVTRQLDAANKRLEGKQVVAKTEQRVEPSVSSVASPNAENPLARLGVGANGKRIGYVPPKEVNFDELV